MPKIHPSATHTMQIAAAVIRIAILATLLALAAWEFTAAAVECHTDSECAAAYPGTNGDPS